MYGIEGHQLHALGLAENHFPLAIVDESDGLHRDHKAALNLSEPHIRHPFHTQTTGTSNLAKHRINKAIQPTTKWKRSSRELIRNCDCLISPFWTWSVQNEIVAGIPHTDGSGVELVDIGVNKSQIVNNLV